LARSSYAYDTLGNSDEQHQCCKVNMGFHVGASNGTHTQR